MELFKMIAGFGFQTSVKESSFNDLSEKFMKKYNVSLIATTIEKSQTQAFIDFAKRNNFKIVPVNNKDLQKIATLTKSNASKKYKDTDCFCEAVALVAAGENSKIIHPQEISNDRLATIAIAQAR
tara:strand:+ start:2585 stop:2959 length:375 start_codon:yes stop_codon:yes gene_type:complete